MESTSEYMETHYYDSKLIGGADASNHVNFNLFWSDYAQFLVDESKTHSEMIQTTLMPILLMIIEL